MTLGGLLTEEGSACHIYIYSELIRAIFYTRIQLVSIGQFSMYHMNGKKY